ncbi:hypothetical protein [Bacillus solitudinis]|uniref:hypothetical protein n=1 Tax=Bacillus solitudinis TaxID=2014074 RepID=UPI000C250F91|nr:hypothetical protein [Bacillus solitudinis]
MSFKRNLEMEWSKFSLVVKQMSSDNPHVRALALESLNRMVESEVGVNKESEFDNKRDVMQRIRVLQHEKQFQRQRRKKWFSMI